MAIIDYEDITRNIIEYLREEQDYGFGTQTRLNYYITLANNAKGDTLLDEIPNLDNRYLLLERTREMKPFKNWIDLSIIETVQLDPNYNKVAKTYSITISSLIKDNLSDGTFYKAVRMTEVLKNIMNKFYEDNKHKPGFSDGRLASILVPSRVMAFGSKTLKTGIIYVINII